MPGAARKPVPTSTLSCSDPIIQKSQLLLLQNLQMQAHQIRDYTTNRQNQVDDVYFVSNDSEDLIMQFYQEHYEKNVQLISCGEIDGYQIWKYTEQ